MPYKISDLSIAVIITVTCSSWPCFFKQQRCFSTDIIYFCWFLWMGAFLLFRAPLLLKTPLLLRTPLLLFAMLHSIQRQSIG